MRHDHRRMRRVVVLLVVLLGTAILQASVGAEEASPNVCKHPSYGSIWGPAFAPLIHNGGKNGKTEELGDVWLRYDCQTNTVYIKVLARDSYPLEQNKEEAWVRGCEYPCSKPPKPVSFSTFAWIGPFGESHGKPTARGWEASVSPVPPGKYEIWVHSNIYWDNEWQTAETYYKGLCLQIACLTSELPNLTVTKGCPSTLVTGPDIDYGITVTNNGGAPAEDVELVDTMPLDVKVKPNGVSSSPSAQCTWDNNQNPVIVYCELNGPLTNGPPPGSWTVTIQAIDRQTSGPRMIINHVEVATTSQEADNTDNTAECPTTTPVTLASFQATRRGDVVRFDWSTATESANAGFDLYAQTADGLARVNAELIPSQAIFSTEPLDYAYEVPDAGATVYYLDDVSIGGQVRRHGPFTLGEAYGQRLAVEPIDWPAIRAEHEAQAAARAAEAQAQVARRLSSRTAYVPPEKAPYSAALPLVLTTSGGSTQSEGWAEPLLYLRVNRDGLYRLTYEALREAGYDLQGVAPGQLALTNGDERVPLYVQAGARFGPGAYIEFSGQALDTLYTDTNVYALRLDGRASLRVHTEKTPPDRKVQPVPFYMETVAQERNREYSFLAPNGDPWYDTMMLAYTTPKSWTFALDAEGYVAGAAPAQLTLSAWGASDLIRGPDHHLVATLNGRQVADEVFDVLDVLELSIPLPEGLLREQGNTLALTLPGDMGAQWDIIALEGYGLSYPRAFRAREGRLAFEAAGAVFQVEGLPTPNVVVYRLTDEGVTRLSGEVAPADDGYRVTFAGQAEPARYLVSTAEALLTPTIAAVRPKADITTGEAQYLVIAHPDFINGLTPLLAVRRAQGLTVRVVDVEDVYAQFGDAIFHPQAIRDYIAYAAANMGTEFVLLVGGDSYDYRDYLGKGAMSFIPSLYAATDDIARFAPVDPLFADLDDDGVPDLALGRLPVRTTAELELLINKTLAYEAKGYSRRAVLAADKGFRSDSESFARRLGEEWTLERAYLDDLSLDDARDALLGAMDGGVALASYVGHSGPASWTFAGLFSAKDAAALNNYGRPMIVTQWGCWNTYYVQPSYNTLAHKFLLSGEQGAAAVLGATTISMDSSERLLGERMMPRLVMPGKTIGAAMLEAKQLLAVLHPHMTDVQLGWTILGDPALVVEP